MGQPNRLGAANLHGLARVQREKRWTTILDGVLAVSVVIWIGSLVTAALPARAHWVLALVVGAMVLHRALVAVERRYRGHTPSAVRREGELLAQLRPEEVHAA